MTASRARSETGVGPVYSWSSMAAMVWTSRTVEAKKTSSAW